MQEQNFVTLLLSLSVWYLNIFSNGSARKAIICDSWWWVGRKCGLDLFTSAHLLLHCDAPVEGDWREPLHIIHRQAEAGALKFQHGHQAFGPCWELNQMDKEEKLGIDFKSFKLHLWRLHSDGREIRRSGRKRSPLRSSEYFFFSRYFTLSYKYLPGPAEDKELNKYRVFFLTAPPPWIW